VIGQLGEVVGHAIAAAERKMALMSDEVIELAVCVRDFFHVAAVGASTASTVRIDHAMPIDDANVSTGGQRPTLSRLSRNSSKHSPLGRTSLSERLERKRGSKHD